MRINNIYNNIVRTKLIQNFSKKISEPKINDKLNTYIPLFESLLITSLYINNTKKSKKIPNENKKFLIINDIFTGSLGALLSISVSKSCKKFIDNVIIDINKSEIKDKLKINNGIKIAMPLMISSLIFRYLLPVISTPISSIIKNKMEKK